MPRRRPILTLVIASLTLLAAPAAAHAALVTNGDFETGSLSGWQVHNSTPLTGNWETYSGTTTPQFGTTVPAPPKGTFAAVTEQSNPGLHILYQDVALPPGGSLYDLSLFAYYHSGPALTSAATLDPSVNPNQQYRIDVMRPSAPIDSVASGDVLLNVFATKTGDPTILAPTLETANLSAFAGQTVRLRFAEVDNQGALDASTDAVAIKTNGFTVGTATLNKKKGIARLPVTLPDDGALKASGKGVKVKIESASGAAAVHGGTATLIVKPKGSTKSKLDSSGKAKVKLKITYTPNGLSATTQKTKLKLKKKR